MKKTRKHVEALEFFQVFCTKKKIKKKNLTILKKELKWPKKTVKIILRDNLAEF